MHKNLFVVGPLCCQVLIKPSNNCQIVEHLPKWRIFAKSGHTAIEPLPIPTVLDCPNSLYDYITFSQYSLHLSLSIGPLISYTHTHPHTHTHTPTHTHAVSQSVTISSSLSTYNELFCKTICFGFR